MPWEQRGAAHRPLPAPRDQGCLALHAPIYSRRSAPSAPHSPLCPSHCRAWQLWAEQGSGAMPTKSFSYCRPYFAVPAQGQQSTGRHGSSNTFSRGKQAGLGPLARQPVFRRGKEEACTEHAVITTTPARWRQLEASIASRPPQAARPSSKSLSVSSGLRLPEKQNQQEARR